MGKSRFKKVWFFAVVFLCVCTSSTALCVEYPNDLHGFNPAKAVDAVVLSELAYNISDDPASTATLSQKLGDLGYYDVVPFMKGALYGQSPSELCTSTGFVCLKDDMVDGKKKTTICVVFQGTTIDSENDIPLMSFIEDAINLDSKSLTDWNTNFGGLLAKDSQGTHLGFLNNALGFFLLQKDIVFPSTNTSLYNMLVSMANGNNEDYQILATGHSLGAATASLYTKLAVDAGIPTSAIAAYTYASPKTHKRTVQPRDYPIFNIVNKKDLVVDDSDLLKLFMDKRMGKTIMFDFDVKGDFANHSISAYVQEVAGEYKNAHIPLQDLPFSSTYEKYPQDYTEWMDTFSDLWNSKHDDPLKYGFKIPIEGEMDYVEGLIDASIHTSLNFVEEPTRKGYPKNDRMKSTYLASTYINYSTILDESDAQYIRIPGATVELYEELLVESAMTSVRVFYPTMTDLEIQALEMEITESIQSAIQNQTPPAKAKPIEFGNGYILAYYEKSGDSKYAQIDIWY